MQSHPEVGQGGGGKGTAGFAELRGFPALTDSISRGVEGVGARLPCAED